MPHYHVNHDLSKAQGVNGDLDWLVMNYFCKPIDNNEDSVVTVFFPICGN